jgi:hypothetical protein
MRPPCKGYPRWRGGYGDLDCTYLTGYLISQTSSIVRDKLISIERVSVMAEIGEPDRVVRRERQPAITPAVPTPEPELEPAK